MQCEGCCVFCKTGLVSNLSRKCELELKANWQGAHCCTDVFSTGVVSTGHKCAASAVAQAERSGKSDPSAWLEINQHVSWLCIWWFSLFFFNVKNCRWIFSLLAAVVSFYNLLICLGKVKERCYLINLTAPAAAIYFEKVWAHGGKGPTWAICCFFHKQEMKGQSMKMHCCIMA